MPLHVVVWLEQHPTAALATALSAGSASMRWHFRVSDSLEVVLRGNRVEVVDARSGTRQGSARIHGVRSAADFDTLPQATEPPPFAPPPVAYPALCGFACDLDGKVARFLASSSSSSSSTSSSSAAVGPGLAPRFTQYEGAELPEPGSLLRALAQTNERPAHPIRVFAARVRDLLAVLSLPTVTGTARAYCWFEGDAVVVWPTPSTELTASAVSALHSRKLCLGSSSYDPRDLLGRGTYRYSKAPRVGMPSNAYVRDDVPIEALDVAAAAAHLGRSTAELAATQLAVRFAEATRVDLDRALRFAT